MSPRLHNLLMTSTALLALGSAYAGAQPTGPNVVGGNATVSGAGTNSVIVNQTSDRAIINWNTFNVSTGGSATFNQPGSSSITLNRVTGGLGPSVIDGTISANGRVFIINRDGMLFGRNAVINTAGFLATTNDIRNADFMAGRMNFNIPGRGDASIVNLGNITASSHGFAALVAPGVRNSGTISANLGTVALASGNSFTLDMYGDRLIQVAVGDEIAGKVIDVATGKPLSSLVTNEGTLRANGGRVEITAAAARHIVDSVINTKGVIEANSVGTRNGRIVLGGATKTAGLPKQTIKVSGKISATGKGKGQTGGTIQITGEDIQFAAAMLDVSGRSGGGKILVGGDYGGGRPIPGIVNNQSAVLENEAIATATTVSVDAATTFNASATANGHGGKVILWSDVLTTFAGTIFARGGEQGGNGGFVEVSGKERLAFSGTVNTLAPNGRTGTLLLDPYNVTISLDGDSNHTDFTATDNDSVINAGTLVTALGSNNVVVSTGAGGSQDGNITVATALTWNAATTLTLQAANNIAINAPITATHMHGGLTIDAGNSYYNEGAVTATAAINVGVFTLMNGNWTQNAATLPDFYARDFRITGGQFLRVTGGNGDNVPYQIADVYGLQGIGSHQNLLNRPYVLANNIDATGTANWNDGKGFQSMGSDGAAFGGSLDGQNFTIDGLTINPGTSVQHVGLFGYTDDATISNLKLTNVNIVGSANGQIIGGLVGYSNGGTSIENVSVSGVISAGSFTGITAGGLVGRNEGTITDAHAAVNVTIGNGAGDITIHHRDAHAGGLVGFNYGSIADSSASGNVTGGGNALVGGLVGTNGDIDSNSATISGSWATGNVVTQTNVAHQMAVAGGLVGDNWGLISTSYATGNVSMSGDIWIMHAGGLVGQLRGLHTEGQSRVEYSYASGNVSVSSTYTGNTNGGQPADVIAGGLVGGSDYYTTVSNAYALGNVSVTGVGNPSNSLLAAGGLIGRIGGSVEYAYSTGTVTAGPDNVTQTALGGFIGTAVYGSNVLSGYWDTDTSGLTTGVGDNKGLGGSPAGLTTAQARTQSCFTGTSCGGQGDFNFSSAEGNWFMVDGQTRPFLRSEWSTTIRNAHQLQLIAMRPGDGYHYTLANDIDFTGRFNEAGMWGSRGFAPIGSSSNPFNGSLSGLNAGGGNFAINGLMLAPNNTTLQSIGLFGTIGATGTVSDLNLTNANVAANIGYDSSVNSQWVGILAGQSGGTIINVHATGTVDGLSVVGVIAGGLVGQHGILTNDVELPHTAGTITGSSANVTVAVADGAGSCSENCMFNAAGGLVGVNVGGSSIVNSHAHGDVSGGALTWAGGLVGQNGFFHPANAQGTITNSWATGNVSVAGNQSAAGGLVGSNVPGSTITGSYHQTGIITGSGGATVGGLVGENHGTITTSHARGAVTLSMTGATDGVAGGFVGANHGNISGSDATGAVSSTNGDVTLGGFAGFNAGSIANSYASGNVAATDPTHAMLGGFVGGNVGEITESYATGNSATNAAVALAGGFVGANFGKIDYSFAKGTVSAGDNSVAGGFVGFNFGDINQAYAVGAVTAGANSYVGAFVGLNLAYEFSTFAALSEGGDNGFGSGSITQSYALGAATGGNAAVAAGFAALNLGSLDQVYGVGRVLGGAGSTLGGLVGLNNLSSSLPNLGTFTLPDSTLPAGTATNSYWDMQTTAVTTSAGGTGMNTAVLAGGLPAGFQSGIWGSHSYPYLLALDNPPLPPQDTNPLPPVIPPVGVDNDPFLPPPDQQINPSAINPGPQSDPVPNVTQFVQQQQQQQQAQQGQQGLTTGSTAQDPIRLDVGENRFFYLPPLNETRLISDEVVLQMPCNVPKAVLDEIIKLHNLTTIASQCLQEGGNAAFRMRHASSQTVAAVIRALAAHQIIAAAQANYVYTTQETSVQSATSQQGDPGQYVPEKLRLLAAHRVVTGNGVPVAVIDSEIDAAHPDLSGTIANRYDATGVEDKPHAHGTGMAGAIVSHQKLLGIAPGARILAIRAFSPRASNTESTTYHILRGIDHAVANNVRIINMSFAGPRDPSIERALKAAYDKGVVLIAAAGNAGPRAPALYPAADPHVIAVTATDIDDRLFAGANRGNHVAIAAPGVDILVPAPAGEYQVTTGTSVATAHISGVVALMLERNAKLTPAEVRKILAASAKRLGPANQFGAGLVDPVRAIEMATPRSAAAPARPRPAAAVATPRATATVAARP